MAQARTIELGDKRTLHVTMAGGGRDVVLIHGALATSHDWIQGAFDLLAEDYRVIAVDRPGHGLSRRPRFDGTPREQARQIKEGMDAIGTDRPVLVGHSFGGIVSLAYAEQFPEAVGGLVLVAPLAFPEVRTLEHSLLAPRAVPLLGPLLSRLGNFTIDRGMIELVQKAMFAPREIPPQWKQSFPYDQVLHRDTMVANGEDAAAIAPFSPAGVINLSRIRAPVHLILGANDMIVNHDHQGKALALLVPDATVTEIIGEGHMIHHGRPDLVVEAVRAMSVAA